MAPPDKRIGLFGLSLDKMDIKSEPDNCTSNLLVLCERYLGKSIDAIEDLVKGWNLLRKDRLLKGEWEFEGNCIRGLFYECGCPHVRSGMIKLCPAQCDCSQEMMNIVFSQVAKEEVKVDIKQSIGRGHDACEFVVTL